LCHLTIEACLMRINGHQWKQIIIKHLPKLKVFRFKMTYHPDGLNCKEEELDRLLSSYRTPFWLVDHQWFVRCRWNLKLGNIHLYTLPYAFDFFDIDDYCFDILTKSTCPFENDYCSYNSETALSFRSSLNDSILSHNRFRNVQQLDLTFPLDSRFLSNILRFDQLTSLFALCHSKSNPDSDLSQLQALIDRAPHVYSLTILAWWSSPVYKIWPLPRRSSPFTRYLEPVTKLGAQ
jgi:hypothetical protein